MVTIVNYGLGNLGSIVNMLKKIGVPNILTSDPADVVAAERLILPGVGHFDKGMSLLHERGLMDALNEAVLRRGVPVMGICLGMQLLLEGSEEGKLPGLGWIKGWVHRFPNMQDEDGKPLKIPHMGWTDTYPVAGKRLFERWDEDETRFYFVHSFHAVCDDPADVAATAHYGIDFTASVEHGHISGCQFHPEKSHRYGMKLLTHVYRQEATA